MKVYLSMISMMVITIMFHIYFGINYKFNRVFYNSFSEMDGLSQNSNKDLINDILFDDFDLIYGLEITNLNQRRFIQLSAGANEGRAEIYFFDPSGKYDITFFYNDKTNSSSQIKVFINGQISGSLSFGKSNSLKKTTLSGINIPQWSKIVLLFTGDNNDKCMLEKLVFTPVAFDDGSFNELAIPFTLRIYESSKERLKARKMFSDYVQFHIDNLFQTRQQELASLNTPEDWQKRQNRIRENLKNYLGEFPKRTSLNAQVVGKLDYEDYLIEKIIFESQPEYYVTANLYIPKGRKFPLPGVLFTCGHSNEGKGQNLYQETCLGLVKKGYIVLSYDPMGQGERSEFFDNSAKTHKINLGVDQHHYFGRAAFITDWTLSGLRIWDGIRAIDYLESRNEVNNDKLAIVGNSGGGQMALLITAVDQRIKVCAAAHPGGSMENTYLLGQTLIDREILSLIPPRPVRIIVGRESGEEVNHRKKVVDMQLFYEGLGYRKDRGEIVIVDGVHDMKKSKRESVYEWLNKWFNKETEGKAEASIEPEINERLWCTESGNTIFSLGGETSQTLNVLRAEQIYKPIMNLEILKERAATRIGLSLPLDYSIPESQIFGKFKYENFSIEKLTYESERGIIIPSLLIKPDTIRPGSPVYIFVSDKGKPCMIQNSSLPFLLAESGFIVFAIDVRGTGETSPVPPLGLNQFTGYTPLQWQNDVLAIQCKSFNRTTLGMRTFDMIKGINFINSRDDLKGRQIITVGEGLGGLWALLTSIYDSRVTGVITIGTLPSYMLIINNQYYNVWGYFWVPGVLRDFDIPDLIRLVSPKPQIWINPIDALGEKLNSVSASYIIGSQKNLLITSSDKVEYKKNLNDLFFNFFIKN